MNADWQARGAPNLEEFNDSIGGGLRVMSDAADAFQSMADMSALTRKHTDVFKNNMQVVIGLIPELLDLATPVATQAEQLKVQMQAIADAMAAANSAIQSVGGGSGSGGSSGGAGGSGGGFGSGGGLGPGRGRGGDPPIIENHITVQLDGEVIDRRIDRKNARQYRRQL
jgi:hypothetical protein